MIYELIEHFLNSRSSFPSDLILWDRLKEEIKLVCINYSKEKWRQLSHEKVNIINRLILLKRRLAAGFDVKTEILDLEVRLNQLFERQLEGSKIRSRAKWLEEGETPSKYFLRVENDRHMKAFVTSVFNSSGTEVSSLPEIIEAHKVFYSNLFSRGSIDFEAQQELFSHVSARLSLPEQASCEGSLTLTEASEALRLSNRNKCPGPDGLTVEFYAFFWDKLGETW